MESLKRFWEAFVEMLKKKKEVPLAEKVTSIEDETKKKDDDEEEDLNEGKKGVFAITERVKNVRGINKKITMGSIIGVVIVFLVSFYASFSDSNSPVKNKENNSSQKIDVEGASGQSINRDLPSKYSELAKFNERKQRQANVPDSEQAQKEHQNANEQVNAIPNNGNTGNYQPNNRNSSGNSNVGYQNSSPLPNYQYAPQYPPQPAYGPQQAHGQGVNPQKAAEEKNESAIRFNITSLMDLSSAAASDGGDAKGAQTGGIEGSSSALLTNVGSYTRYIPNTLMPGTIIPAILISGINSDLPGQVVAQVRQDVYDSVTGNVLLVPQGSRLVGRYGSVTGAGQSRISINWEILILPNGNSINIGSMAAVDSEGYAGLHDKVNDHSGKILGLTALTSVLAAVATVASGNVDTDNMTTGQLAAQGATTNMVNAASKFLERGINVNPTITIRPGMNFNVLVGQMIVLAPYRQSIR